MKNPVIATAILTLAGAAGAEPVIYTDEAFFLSDLAPLAGSTLHESFEDDAVWGPSRNSTSSPGSTSAVTSQEILWKSNYPQNDIATGTVGASAPDGVFAIYSVPHGATTDSGSYCDSAEDPDIPIECFQNDGIAIESEPGDTLFAFGGRIDTANSGKVTFLLDGVDTNGNDTDNIDNWQREGDFADDWAFVGVIDADGFRSAELRELRGKDAQQVRLFADDFTIRRSIPEPPAGWLRGTSVIGLVALSRRRRARRTRSRARPPPSHLTRVTGFVIFAFSNMKSSELFSAFANQTRLRLLSLLHDQKELCVCDLSEVLDEPQPKVSRHLAILREAGLVEVRSEGKWKFYGLAQPPTPLHQTLLRCVGTCLAEFDEVASDRDRLSGIEARMRCR